MLAALLLALGAIGWFGQERGSADTTPLGLFTSLPILWSDSADLGAEIAADAPRHWAKAVLAQHGRVIALDTLANAGPPGPLAGLTRLVMAQPRALSPLENVALDDWVRGGGQLLLLADPALTEDSPLGLGDPRRPLTGVMLSPILARWGLDLRFDDAQPLEEATRDVMGLGVPVNLPGRFETRGQANCKLWGDGLAVTCAIGRGRVIAVADAALLDRHDPAGTRPRLLSALLDSAFVAR